MKKIHLLILKAFIRPFIVTFLIVMFVLLMLFLFKYIDDLVGKGFEWYVILELMVYASATNVAMALPLSVLLSSIMTYGSLGENYELVAIKAAGISLGRALYPMVIVVGLLSMGAFFFSEYMLPVANLKYYSLLYDVRKQKNGFLITENVFNNTFPGYSIRVKHKDPDGQTLREVMIYERPPEMQTGNLNVIFAKEGVMYRSRNDEYLILKLKDGIRYEETSGENGYNQRQRLTRFRFKERVQKFDLSGLKIKRTNQDEFKGAFQMMNRKQLDIYRDSANHLINLGINNNYKLITPYFKYFSFPHKMVKLKYDKGNKDALAGLIQTQKAEAFQNAINEAKGIKEQIKLRAQRYDDLVKDVRRSRVEYMKKFTLSAACLVLFLIGAPLGAIIRKGGLGLPVVVSVVFFLIYHIISTISEKSVKDGAWHPVIGMWLPIALLTPVGLFLSYKAANDSVLFDPEAYKRITKRIAAFFQKKVPQ